MISVCWQKIHLPKRSPWLACWPVICCLALSGCASKAPERADEPSSYPPWVCGLSHNQDRWQCLRKGEAQAPSAAPATSPQPAPDGEDAAPQAAADASAEPADQASAPAWQAPSATEPKRTAFADPAEEKNKLMALPPDYFAIQAGAFPSADALQRHTLQYGIEPAYRARLASEGRLFHVLILQVYDSRRAAEVALANLPQPLNGMDLWIRSTGSLQNAVRAGDALANQEARP